jgi:hypothetical protein
MGAARETGTNAAKTQFNRIQAIAPAEFGTLDPLFLWERGWGVRAAYSTVTDLARLRG